MSPRHRSNRWLERHVEAVRRAAPDAPEGFWCPLCGLGYPRDSNEISLEHAVPQALGGKEILLTCRACNSQAGAQLDTHVVRGRRLQEVAAGIRPLTVSGRLGVGAASQNVEVTLSPGSMLIAGSAHRNPPGAGDAVAEEIETAGADGDGLKFRFSGSYRIGNPRRLAIGWMRSAYLAAFAFLGYRWAFGINGESLAFLRDQIASCDELLISPTVLKLGRPAGASPSLMFVLEPKALRCIAVEIDDRIVLLPGLDYDPDFFQRMASTLDGPASRSDLSGKVLPWPTEPQLALDFGWRPSF